MIVELLQPWFARLQSGQALSPGLAFLTGALADVLSTAAVWPLAFARISLAVGKQQPQPRQCEAHADPHQQDEGAKGVDHSQAESATAAEEEQQLQNLGPFGRIAHVIRVAVRDHGFLRLYYGLKEESLGLSLKGGIRWMVKPTFDAVALALTVRLLGKRRQ